MADDKLDALSQQLGRDKSVRHPPLHLWNPPLSGDIDILIRRDGSWVHEGDPIHRAALVRLFASILRREEDGEYYLVTPVEKWRIRVEGFPLLIVDFELDRRGTDAQVLGVTTNVGTEYEVSSVHPLFLSDEGIPAVALDHGIDALFNRAAWYRLAELADETSEGVGLLSAGEFYIFG
jgi:hypothetical protein